MGLSKLAEKVAKYRERLERGSAKKIKPSHVNAVLAKLNKKAIDLKKEISAAKSADRKDRLGKKLDIAREHIKRAKWLLREIT